MFSDLKHLSMHSSSWTMTEATIHTIHKKEHLLLVKHIFPVWIQGCVMYLGVWVYVCVCLFVCLSVCMSACTWVCTYQVKKKIGGATFHIPLTKSATLNRLLHCSLWQFSGALFCISGVKSPGAPPPPPTPCNFSLVHIFFSFLSFCSRLCQWVPSTGAGRGQSGPAYERTWSDSQRCRWTRVKIPGCDTGFWKSKPTKHWAWWWKSHRNY